LVRLPAGAQGRVVALNVPASDAAALEAMGLVVGALVRVCRVGQPTIVAVLNGDPASGCACGGSRLGLAHDLAMQINVQPLVSCAGGGAEGAVSC
jgi:alcohol dehydrogenase class IV